MLELAAETAADWTTAPAGAGRGPCRADAAGGGGSADRASAIGYHAGLLSLAAMKSASEDEIIAHCEAVAREIPLVGFYLQPAVGGVILSADFWRRFASIDNVIAIKIAPFNRYRTLDVLRGVAAAGALDRVALYTGNDDHILLDLTLPFDLRDNGVTTRAYFRGGLLGHWSVWTASAIKQFETLPRRAGQGHGARPTCWRSTPASPTATAPSSTSPIIFMAASPAATKCCGGRACCEGIWCLDPAEGLSPGQMQEIDRVCREHADLGDDAFVAANLQKWLA